MTDDGSGVRVERAKVRAEARQRHVTQALADHATLLAQTSADWPCATYRLAAEDAGASFETDSVWSWEHLVVPSVG